MAIKDDPVTRRMPPAAMVLLAVAALVACDKPKPRHPPPDPMAVAPPMPPAPAPVAAPVDAIAPLSGGLPKRAEPATFTIDTIGAAVDPLNRKPAVTPAGEPIVIRGFGLDPVVLTPGKGLDIVIDGAAYGTAYGAGRNDVAAFFRKPGLTKVGFAVTLPAGAVAPGPHRAQVRVVAADGKSYYEGLAIGFEVR
jgi:hypothetical protein